ncbi:sensor histidine kinase [Clostridium chromiireducens]|uniref:sensor histidine kinase n=1 Tax=Clostridium chromiireducens TaxID=225345 RepID=UPI003AF8E791
MWNKISLRLRLTLLTGAILTGICIILTTISVFNAERNFAVPIDYINNPIGYKEAADSVFIYSASDQERKEPEGALIIASNYGETATFVPGNSEKVYDQDGKELERASAISAVRATQLFETSKTGFAKESLAYMIAIILGGAFFVWSVAGSALKPVTALSETVESIDENNLNITLPFPESKDEIAKLTTSFNRMLQKINKSYESQKRFSQNAAHELKTPLSSMLTNIEVMELGEKAATIEEYKETFSVLKQNVERMSTLVADLLTLNASANENDVCVISSDKFFKDILNDYSDNIKEIHLNISVNGEINFKGNKFLLERAFSNIIQNAVRYNKKNGQITIECNTNEIIISDTGIGIPKDEIDNIFEPFYCVDTSRSRVLGGSGLGLAITKQIFDKYNIQINVESELRKGTKFKITGF